METQQIQTNAEGFQNNIIARNARIRALHAAGTALSDIANECVQTKRFAETADEKVAVVSRVLGLA